MRLATSLLLILTCVLYAACGQAQTAAEARQTLENTVTDILNCIKDPAYANPATRAPLRQQIEKKVESTFDFEEFSLRTVGPKWRTFTPEEKQRFSNAFAKLLFNTYLNKITGYNGEQISYTGEAASPDGKLVEIRTVITMKDGKKTPVNYRMLYKNGNWRIYDVIIENISLVKNYRTQFQDILNTATPAQLIQRVESKAQEVLAQGKQDAKK